MSRLLILFILGVFEARADEAAVNRCMELSAKSLPKTMDVSEEAVRRYYDQDLGTVVYPAVSESEDLNARLVLKWSDVVALARMIHAEMHGNKDGTYDEARWMAWTIIHRKWHLADFRPQPLPNLIKAFSTAMNPQWSRCEPPVKKIDKKWCTQELKKRRYDNTERPWDQILEPARRAALAIALGLDSPPHKMVVNFASAKYGKLDKNKTFENEAAKMAERARNRCNQRGETFLKIVHGNAYCRIAFSARDMKKRRSLGPWEVRVDRPQFLDQELAVKCVPPTEEAPVAEPIDSQSTERGA